MESPAGTLSGILHFDTLFRQQCPDLVCSGKILRLSRLFTGRKLLFYPHFQRFVNSNRSRKQVEHLHLAIEHSKRISRIVWRPVVLVEFTISGSDERKYGCNRLRCVQIVVEACSNTDFKL